MVKALYGHSHAGDFWHDRFHAELITLEFKTIDGWPSAYVCELNKKDRIVMCVYVDDLVIFGPKAMYPVLEALRKDIQIPGNALHEKGLQRQKGVGPLVSSQEQRALLVPVINRLSTAGQPRILFLHRFT